MGCSSPLPPKMTPIFTLFMPAPRGESQAVGQRVLDHVAECVVGVVRGVRTDDHVRQLLQPEQRPALDRLASAVAEEYAFLAFEDVQPGSSEPAAFQGRDERL